MSSHYNLREPAVEIFYLEPSWTRTAAGRWREDLALRAGDRAASGVAARVYVLYLDHRHHAVRRATLDPAGPGLRGAAGVVCGRLWRPGSGARAATPAVPPCRSPTSPAATRARASASMSPARRAFADESASRNCSMSNPWRGHRKRSRDQRQGRAIARLEPLLIGSIFPIHGEDRIVVTPQEVPRCCRRR